MLAVVGYGELTHVEVLGGVVDVGRLDRPGLVADGDVGGIDHHMGVGVALRGLAKGCGGVEMAFGLAVVEPTERHGDEVVGGLAARAEVEQVAVVLVL